VAAEGASRASPDQRAGRVVHHPVVIVGAGPVGLALAIDLALRGVETVLLEAESEAARTGARFGSRAICYAKRSLEILDRLGVGQRMLDKGVTWQKGKVFWRERMVYEFDLLPEAGHRMPAFVNCQQYHLERYLIERAQGLGVDLRFGHRVTGVVAEAGGVGIAIATPAGDDRLSCDWLLACDGARSTVRRALGLGFEGQVFQDKFLITDVRMAADFPPERWFWFDPPFHPGQSALLHSQPDQVWRIDLQLGPQADPEEEARPERVIPRLRAMLGEHRRFELEWTSVYTFRCRRLARFRHGRVLFLGDAAHEVSPFGARGFNSGIQDADNLAWKLACVLRNLAPERLLDSYDEERLVAADENIRHSTRSTEFITPKNAASRAYRDAVLQLAEHHPFARRMLNSGRLSTPTWLDSSSLNTPDAEGFAGGLAPGSPAEDAPLRQGDAPRWLIGELSEPAPVPTVILLLFLASASALTPALATALRGLAREPVPIATRVVLTGAERAAPSSQGLALLTDCEGLAAARYAALPGTCYLFRPDQHVAARSRRFDADRVRAATRRALAGETAPIRALADA
jgi:3-(3-hydroxy-phenyl)propionate hydroxylase